MQNCKKIYPTYLDCKVYLSHLIFPSDKIKDTISSSTVSERINKDERVLQYIWNEGLLNILNAKTVSGHSIDIINHGRWNGEMGPDFLHAEIKISDKLKKGDIEIHINSSDWKNHSHHNNNLYRNVILHVFLNKTDKEIYDILPNGNHIDRLELAPFIFPNLDIIEKALGNEEYLYRESNKTGECYSVFSNLDRDFLEHFFDLAGRERINDKVSRFASQMHLGNMDQLFYQSLMTSMGHKGTKALFFLLSKRVPIREMKDFSKGLSKKDRIELIEAILLHTANLVPPPEHIRQNLDDETQYYLNSINKWWAEFSIYLKDRIIPPTNRWFAGMRPANFPTRRIAGIARLIGSNFESDEDNNSLFKAFFIPFEIESKLNQSRKTLNLFYKKLIGKFSVEDLNSYWAGRFSFKNTKKSKPQDLIGANTAKSIIFNALIPLAILHSQKIKDEKIEKFIWYTAENYPSLEKNILTKFMALRLFGKIPKLNEDFFAKEIHNQALLKIFYDACGNNEISCEQCSFRALALKK